MEIEVTPVTLEKRIEFLQQTVANKEANKKSFPWMVVIITVIVSGGICLAIAYNLKKKNEKRVANS